MSGPTTQQNRVRGYTSKDWDSKRFEIARLYQCNTLEKVRFLMRQHHGLDATAKQYKDRISKWGFYKNVQTEELEAILRKKRERTAKNKPSAFRVRKQPVNPEKITRYMKENPRLAVDVNDGLDIEGVIASADALSGISVYIPSNTGPQTPLAASSPPENSNDYFETSPRQALSHFHPTSNIISPPTLSSNLELFSTPPTPLPQHPDTLMMDHISPVLDSVQVPPSPALSISSIVQASTNGFMGQSPAPTHQNLPNSPQEPGYGQGVFQPHSSLPELFSQIQLEQQLLVPAKPRYNQTIEENLRGELSMIETLLGGDHQDTLSILSTLAKVLMDQGRYRSAEELIRRLLIAYSDGNEDNKIGRLKALHLLSHVLYRQGIYSKAEKISLYTVRSRKPLLGVSHRDTLQSMTILALTNLALGRMDVAQELLLEIMETRKRDLGDDHKAMLEILNYLGSTYSQMGLWEKAALLHTEALERRRRVLGDEHRDTLASMYSLASTYQGQGRWGESEKLGAQTLEILKRVLGEEHPSTLLSRVGLACTYYGQGRWSEAGELGVETLKSMKRVLGEGHPNTLFAMEQLAHTWKSLGRHDEAKTLMAQCAKLRIITLGYDHPGTQLVIQTLSQWGISEFQENQIAIGS